MKKNIQKRSTHAQSALWTEALERFVSVLDAYIRQKAAVPSLTTAGISAASATDCAEVTSPAESPRLRLWRGHPGRVTMDGRPVTLGRCAWRLLCLLAKYPGQVVSYEDMSIVWENETVGAAMSRKQLQAHRMILNTALTSASGARTEETEMVTLVHGCGFCLELAPSDVLIVVD